MERSVALRFPSCGLAARRLPTDVVLFSQKQAKGSGTQDAQIQVQKCKLSIAGGPVQVRKDRFPRTERILTPVPGCM